MMQTSPTAWKLLQVDTLLCPVRWEFFLRARLCQLYNKPVSRGLGLSLHLCLWAYLPPFLSPSLLLFLLNPATRELLTGSHCHPNFIFHLVQPEVMRLFFPFQSWQEQVLCSFFCQAATFQFPSWRNFRAFPFSGWKSTCFVFQRNLVSDKCRFLQLSRSLRRVSCREQGKLLAVNGKGGEGKWLRSVLAAWHSLYIPTAFEMQSVWFEVGLAWP